LEREFIRQHDININTLYYKIKSLL